MMRSMLLAAVLACIGVAHAQMPMSQAAYTPSPGGGGATTALKSDGASYLTGSGTVATNGTTIWAIGGWFKKGALNSKFVATISNLGTVLSAIVWGYNTGDISTYLINGSVTDNLAISDTNWHYVLWRANGTVAYDKFIDGVKTNISTGTGIVLHTSASFLLFSDGPSGDTVDGSMYQWAVWNGAVPTDTDVTNLASKANTPGNVSNPAGHWWILNNTTSDPDQGTGTAINLTNIGTGLSTVTGP